MLDWDMLMWATWDGRRPRLRTAWLILFLTCLLKRRVEWPMIGSPKVGGALESVTKRCWRTFRGRCWGKPCWVTLDSRQWLFECECRRSKDCTWRKTLCVCWRLLDKLVFELWCSRAWTFGAGMSFSATFIMWRKSIWLEGQLRTNMVLLIWHLVNCCTVGTVLGGGDCRVADYWVILMRSQGSLLAYILYKGSRF